MRKMRMKSFSYEIFQISIQCVNYLDHTPATSVKTSSQHSCPFIRKQHSLILISSFKARLTLPPRPRNPPLIGGPELDDPFSMLTFYLYFSTNKIVMCLYPFLKNLTKQTHLNNGEKQIKLLTYILHLWMKFFIWEHKKHTHALDWDFYNLFEKSL